MKRLLLFLLVVLLMLSGCKRQPDAQNTSTPPETEGINELYVENSSVEQKTGGAVRQYALPGTYFKLSRMGSNLLVVGEKGMMVLSGDLCEVIATVETEGLTYDMVMDTAATGMAYYMPGTRQVILRNPLLQISTQLQLPENIEGTPRISLTKNEIYYSIGSEIRAMNISTGISRLIRQQASATQKLLGDYFDGSVLRRLSLEEGKTPVLDYISSETGAILGDGADVSRLYTYGTRYIAYWKDGTVEQTAFGVRGETAYSFLKEAPHLDVGRQAAMPECNGIVNYETADGGLILDFFDLQAGKRTAQVVLPGEKLPADLYCDGTYIWALSGDRLYRWNTAKSSVEDETVYTGPLYSAQQPDTEGLAQCQATADAMSAQYGVKLLIWENAVQKTGGYTVTAEHQTQAITGMLEKLDPVLAQFPKGFLQSTIKNGWIRIALVRSIEDHPQCVQFWEGGDSWILLPVYADTAPLIERMSYAIVSHVRGNSRDLDEDRWMALNPKDFVYTGNNSDLEKPEYLEGDNRAFADRLSMSYPYEDQNRIFYYAMLADNADMFRTPVMQAKLQQLCMGIREAYRLKKDTNTFVWEQYLQTSLAYTGK